MSYFSQAQKARHLMSRSLAIQRANGKGRHLPSVPEPIRGSPPGPATAIGNDSGRHPGGAMMC